MKKKILLVFVLIVVSFVAVKSTAFVNVKESNTTFAVVEKEEAKDLYAQHCARCHGADGKGNTALGRTFKAPDLTKPNIQRRSNSRFTKSIKNGRGNMPAFAKKLSDQDIAALILYVRSLKR